MSEDYTKRNIPDDDVPLNERISSAMANKKPIEKHSPNGMTSNSNTLSVTDIIAQAMAKKNANTNTLHGEEESHNANDDYSTHDNNYYEAYNKALPVDNDKPDEGFLSIEAMVANAMNKIANNETVSSERFVTPDDAIIDEVVPTASGKINPPNEYNDNYDDEYVGDEDEEGFDSDDDRVQSFDESPVDDIDLKPVKKPFFRRYRVPLIITSSIAGLALLCVGLFYALVYYYIGRTDTENTQRVTLATSAPSENDTIDANQLNEYEEWLKNQLKGNKDILSSEEVTNVLLVGEDVRALDDNNVRGNTDVMLLISINSKMETITVTSFMRDIYLQIPGEYSTRLNAAYAMGGCKLLGETISQNFGIDIDNYVIVNFKSFMTIIDAIGGIEVEITDNMIDPLRAPIGEQNTLLGKDLRTDFITKPGTYTLNGNQALGYVRIRHGVGDDYGRTQRQREVISKMITKSKQSSISELKSLLDSVIDEIQTDIDGDMAVSLIYHLITEYNGYDIQQLQIPANRTFTTATIRNMDVLCPDFAKNSLLLQMTIYGRTLVDDTVTNTYTLPTRATTIETPPPVTTTSPETTTISETTPYIEPPTQSDVTTSSPDIVTSTDSEVTTTPPTSSTTPPVCDTTTQPPDTTPPPIVTTP